MRRLGLVCLALLAGLSVAAADTVHLRDGRKYVGKVTSKPGKVVVEMKLGTIELNAADVLLIDTGTAVVPDAAASLPEEEKSAPVSLGGAVYWDSSACTLPEAMLFMLARQEQAGFADSPPDTTSAVQLNQWRIYAHEGRRKLGSDWLTRPDQRRRRAAYDKALRDADDVIRQAHSVYGQTPADQARRKDLEAKATKAVKDAIALWPDPIIQDFLSGVTDLQAKDFTDAEAHFRRCCQAEPLVAAFHQGRGLALAGLKRPMPVLTEFVAAVALRDDNYELLQTLETAMKDVPGTKTSDAVYLQAQAILDRYEPPKNPYRSYGGTPWMMPGPRSWQWRDDQGFTPPYDRVVTRQTIGVPIADNVLIVDEEAIRSADLLYVEIAPGKVVYAEPMQRGLGSTTAKTTAYLAGIKVTDATFTPVEMDKLADPKKGQELTLKTVNCYRQMGTAIRSPISSVGEAAERTIELKKSLQPGESMAAAFAGEDFVGFVSGRTDFEAEDFGNSSLFKAADLAAAIDPIKRSLRYSSSNRFGRPTLKADAPKLQAQGKVFLVHILVGEKPPAQVSN